MSLEVAIRHMQYPPLRPDLRHKWIRRGLRPTSSLPVIGNLKFTVDRGEVMALVGASGSGKTTVLRIVAGLEHGFDGSVKLNGAEIVKADRRIYLMPQAHTLLPWLTAEQNLLFNVPAGKETCMPEELLEKFKLLGRRHAYPATLSGGERARIALMCAMCAAPEVLLLDEPFRGLDQITSEECQEDLVSWFARTDVEESVILVSHSIPDAVFLADRVMVVYPCPLREYKQFVTSSIKNRHSDAAAKLEKDILRALRDVSPRCHHP